MSDIDNSHTQLHAGINNIEATGCDSRVDAKFLSHSIVEHLKRSGSVEPWDFSQQLDLLHSSIMP